MPRLFLLAALLLAACGGSTPDVAKIIPAMPIPGEPAIPYPPELFAKGIEGEVLLLLLVDSTGAVIRDSSQVARSSGYSEFDAAALLAAGGLRFTPATRDGVPIAAPIQVPIKFTIPDTATAARNKKP